MTLELPVEIRRAMVRHAREGRPREVCGVLGGRFGDEESRVTGRSPTANVATDPRTRYEVDPAEALAAFERIESGGEEIVGFYHSHPRGLSKPSEIDAAQATWPDRSYVIVSLDAALDGGSTSDVAVGSWRWRNAGGFEREAVESIDRAD